MIRPIVLTQLISTRPILARLTEITAPKRMNCEKAEKSGLCDNPKRKNVMVKFESNNFIFKKLRGIIQTGALIRVIKKRLNLPDDQFFLIDLASNTCLQNFVDCEKIGVLRLCKESKFGGDDESVSEGDSVDETECIRKRDVNSCFTIMHSNVSGGLGNSMTSDKKRAIKAMSINDTVLLLSEINCVADDTPMLVRSFGVDGKIVSLEDWTYDSKGQRVKPAGARKISAYGSAILSRDADLCEWPVVDPVTELGFEIVPVVFRRGATCGLQLTGYRSPNMRDVAEISSFYKEVQNIIEVCKERYHLDYVIYAMDDNKASNEDARLSMEKTLSSLGLANLIGDQPTRFGRRYGGKKNKKGAPMRDQKDTQPDTVWAWYDPFKVRVSACVIGKITEKMDHSAIRIKVDLFGVKPRKPKYRNVIRRVKTKDDCEIGEKLQGLTGDFIENFEHKVVEGVEGKVVDTATERLYEIISEVKRFGWTEKTVRLPDCVKDKDDKWTVRIGVEHAKMEKLGVTLKKEPTNKKAMEEFREAQDRCLEFMREKRDADCDRDMQYARTGGKVNLRNFYKWADNKLSKSSFGQRVEKELTEKEKIERLEAHDATFRSKDPNFECKMKEKCDVKSDRVFCLDDWDPSNGKGKLEEFIRKSKKVDKFYKINAEYFAKPIFILLKMIQEASYFPHKMRSSKATFIPGPRTIFSLEALSKFVEGILTIEFNVCMEAEYGENGDPEGFAYRKNRGVSSCMGIALTDVERSTRRDGLAAVMVFCDLKKAFNSVCRSTMVEVAQKSCGAGGIVRSRFIDRTYMFEGQRRGHDANCGVDAGTPLSVWGFDCAIKTDKSTTAHNDELLSHPHFSDDRNITGSGKFVESGRFQMCISCDKARNNDIDECQWSKSMQSKKGEAILCAYCFAKKEGMEFHEAGKKGPEAMAFAQKIKSGITPKPDGSEVLKLGKVDIPVVDRQKVLGLNIATYPKSKDRETLFSKIKKGEEEFKNVVAQKAYENQALKIVEKYGYFLEPNIVSIRSLAYRFQVLKDEQDPKRLWQAVMAYLVGKLRYCAAFYYLRSTTRQLDTIRFYYGMGVSAILGMTAYETLGASCCKSMRVSEDSKALKLLLEITGMPSLKELAETDARTFIKQCVEIKPDWFLPNNERVAIKEIERKKSCIEEGKKYFPKFCSLEKNTLAWQCWEIVKLSLNNNSGHVDGTLLTTGFLARINKTVGGKVITNGVKRRVKGMEKFEIFWEASIEASRQRFGRIHSRCVKDTYKLMCAESLEVLEENDRQCNFRTPSRPLVMDKRCSVYPPIQNRTGETVERAIEFDCNKMGPQIYLPEIYRRAELKKVFACMLCGDFVKADKGVKCRSCLVSNRVVHTWCCRKLKLNQKKFCCSDIKKQLVPSELGSRKVFQKDVVDDQMMPARFHCLVCGEFIAEWEPEYVGKRAFVHDDVVFCKHSKDMERACQFGVHSQCLLVHNKWLLGRKKFDENDFECNMIEFNMDSKTVAHMSKKRLVGRKQKIENLKKTNRIRYSNDKRKRRYENPNNMCKYCGQEIPREQRHHLMFHCTGLSTTPVIRGQVTDLRATARRCLEIVCADKPSLKPSTVRKRRCGELDGESLAELTPKRQRRNGNMRHVTKSQAKGHAARPSVPGGTG